MPVGISFIRALIPSTIFPVPTYCLPPMNAQIAPTMPDTTVMTTNTVNVLFLHFEGEQRGEEADEHGQQGDPDVQQEAYVPAPRQIVQFLLAHHVGVQFAQGPHRIQLGDYFAYRYTTTFWGSGAIFDTGSVSCTTNPAAMSGISRFPT